MPVQRDAGCVVMPFRRRLGSRGVCGGGRGEGCQTFLHSELHLNEAGAVAGEWTKRVRYEVGDLRCAHEHPFMVDRCVRLAVRARVKTRCSADAAGRRVNVHVQIV